MGKKILLADDSITIQKVVELTFSDSDFDVISVGNGEQALRKAREMRPDIALLDVIMPEKNGYEVCQILKQDPDLRRTPVLLLTGTFESFDRERAAAVGADGYLTKPFESQMLISKVEELLANAPRQVPVSERSSRMEVVTEGRIMTVESPPPEPEADAPPKAPAAGAPPASAAPPAAESWEEEAPGAQEVSFPERPVEPAPEARAAFREWSSVSPPPPEPDPAPETPPAEDSDEGPPPAATPRAGPPSRRAAEPPAPARPPIGYPDRPLAPDTYEQTFVMEEHAEPVPLAAPPPSPAPGPRTLYSGPEPPAAAVAITPELIDQIVRRVVERLSDQVIREVAWEVIPDLAEILIRQRINELEQGGKPRR